MKKVITYGSFDLFHEGHYNLLKHAKELGDYLIVGVTTEQYDESRGKLNVIDSLEQRMENVRKTGFADMVIVEDHIGQKIEDIQKYNVDVFTVGSDWQGKFDYIKDFCEVVYLPRTKNISSTMLRTRNHPIIRIGVVGSGRIAGRFVDEAKLVSGVIVRSVYNPHKTSADAFMQKWQLELAFDDFEAFLKTVDAVYVASPHQTHYEYAQKAILSGKHVLCEKPLCFKKVEAEELFALADENNVILLEALKTAYSPGFVQLLSVARSGLIGNIRDVEATFTRLTNPSLREMTDTQYGGSFTEFGSYTLLPIIKLMGKDYKKIYFESIKADNGLDLYTKSFITFDKGFGQTKTGLGVKSEGQLLISGTKGYILAPSPWWLTKEFEVRFEDPSKVEKYFVKFLGYGLRYEISDFAHLINGFDNRSFKLTSGESIAMADIMERFMAHRKAFLEKYHQ